jgi:hypothetical protein
MENDKAKFKNEFKNRLYSWELRLIKFNVLASSILTMKGKK